VQRKSTRAQELLFTEKKHPRDRKKQDFFNQGLSQGGEKGEVVTCKLKLNVWGVIFKTSLTGGPNRGRASPETDFTQNQILFERKAADTTGRREFGFGGSRRRDIGPSSQDHPDRSKHGTRKIFTSED